MKAYNWWTDPNNSEEVKRISWWNHEENKRFVNIPISVVKSERGYVAAFNDDSKKFLGSISVTATQGSTEEKAIDRLFENLQWLYSYQEECRLSYQRWVPFRKGPWGKTGGNWFTIFGMHVYFRYGNKMKGGWYFPFTKLNISFSSDWRVYRAYKKKG
jgi:hypothetical protein